MWQCTHAGSVFKVIGSEHSMIETDKRTGLVPTLESELIVVS